MTVKAAAIACAFAYACLPASAEPIPPHSCTSDAAVQQLTGAARKLFVERCENGRTAPIAGTPNEPANANNPTEVCRAKAIGDKMTGEARGNYVRSCISKDAK